MHSGRAATGETTPQKSKSRLRESAASPRQSAPRPGRVTEAASAQRMPSESRAEQASEVVEVPQTVHASSVLLAPAPEQSLVTAPSGRVEREVRHDIELLEPPAAATPSSRRAAPDRSANAVVTSLDRAETSAPAVAPSPRPRQRRPAMRSRPAVVAHEDEHGRPEIRVHIGRVELRQQPDALPPPVRRPGGLQPARGFSEYSLLRHHLDRPWWCPQ